VLQDDQPAASDHPPSGRRDATGSEYEAGPSKRRQYTNNVREAEARAKLELDEGLRGKGKGKAREEVVVEKSNVLMV
jgi:ATP-dependent Clp protease ATP-binding subunit ClpX